jgi:hypothetical protein
MTTVRSKNVLDEISKISLPAYKGAIRGILNFRPPLEHRRFNADQKFVLVTAGSDVQTLQAVRYWPSKGLPIEIKTYHVFKDDDRFYITFDSFAPDVEDYTRLARR